MNGQQTRLKKRLSNENLFIEPFVTKWLLMAWKSNSLHHHIHSAFILILILFPSLKIMILGCNMSVQYDRSNLIINLIYSSPPNKRRKQFPFFKNIHVINYIQVKMIKWMCNQCLVFHVSLLQIVLMLWTSLMCFHNNVSNILW
jgi:hypothetical protein